MLQTLKNAWKIPELRKKLLFTLFILLIYRLGSVIPVPFIDVTTLANYFDSVLSSTILGLYNAMSGSAFSRATVLALGIQPYINASIIIQLLTVAIPALERLGVVAAFGDQADFSNLSDTPAYVSSVSQESRIGLDENGVEASAYTKVDIMEMSALPDPSVIEELEFNLDRPFLYEIRTRQGIPLFAGLCAQPDAVA